MLTVPSFPGPSPGSAVNKPGFPWRGSEASHVGGGGGSVSRTPATPPPERHLSSSQTAQWAAASRRRGCPWQREPQAGRSQTRWAHSLKAKAEPGWGAREPEAWGVGGRDPTAAPPHGHRSCLPGQGHRSGLYPTPQDSGPLSRSPRPGPRFSAHSTHTEGSGGEDGDPRATHSGTPISGCPRAAVPRGVCQPPSAWSLSLAWLGLSEPCAGGHTWEGSGPPSSSCPSLRLWPRRDPHPSHLPLITAPPGRTPRPPSL